MHAEFWLGQRLKTRRNIHRVAEHRDACVGTGLHTAHYCWSGIEADAHLRPDAVLSVEVAPNGFEPLQDRKRGTTRPQRRVFEGHRRAEDRHDAVAGETLNDAALLAHGVIHQLRKAAHEGIGGLLPRTLGEGGKANHVREKDGDLPTLGVQATLLIWMRVAASFCLGSALSAIPLDRMSVTSGCGPLRHFAATQQFGRFRNEADIQRAALTARIYEYAPI